MSEVSSIALRRGASAARLLRGLDRSGFLYAVLHGEHLIANSVMASDLDIVVGPAVHEARATVVALAKSMGYYEMVCWPYDYGALTLILLDPAARVTIQIDLLHDPRGRGKYGVRTDAVLNRRVRGIEYWKLADADERRYLVSKRLTKRQHERMKDLFEVRPSWRDLRRSLSLRRVVGVRLAPWTAWVPARVVNVLRPRSLVRLGRRVAAKPIGCAVIARAVSVDELLEVFQSVPRVEALTERTSSNVGALRLRALLYRPSVLVVAPPLARALPAAYSHRTFYDDEIGLHAREAA